MHEKVQAYFDMLAQLSDEELDRSAQALAAHEKHDTARLVAHIAEMGERTCALALGYRTVFAYCVKRLNLSEGAVYRKMQVARVCRKFPTILEAMSQGRLHLTGASLIAPHLTEENVESLTAKAQGTTKREVEELLVALSPKEPFEQSIRKQPIRQAELPAPEPRDPGMPRERREAAAAEATPTGSAGPKRTYDLIQPATEDRYNVRFSADKAFTEKLTRLAEVLGIECPRSHLEEILSRALDIALEHKDPRRRLERRRAREARKEAACPGEGLVKNDSCRGDQEPEVVAEMAKAAQSRHVPAAVRERVLERAGHQCEYRGPDGTRCSSRTGLQVEHTLPFAVHRSHDEKHLRAYCPAHNLHAARAYYGNAFVQRKIEAARRQRAKRCRAVVVA